MIRPILVEPLPRYHLRLSFRDGTTGTIDMSSDVGRGVFKPLEDEAFFRKVHIGKYGQIAWSEEIEICPDAAYNEIRSRTLVEAAGARS